MCVLSCSVMSDSATPWTVALQAPLSMGFSRQECCSGFPFPIPGDLPTEGSNLHLLHLLHCRQIPYCWATTEAPNFLWVGACVTIIQCNTWLEVYTVCYVLDRWMNISYKEWQCSCHRNSVQLSCSVGSDSLQPCGLKHASLPCPSLTPGAYSNSCQLCWWHPTISSSVVPFSSLLQPFLASGYFQMSRFFVSGGQSIGASGPASVLPVNIQDWFPLGLTGWISLQPRDSQESSPTTQFKSIKFLALSFLYSPTLTSI